MPPRPRTIKTGQPSTAANPTAPIPIVETAADATEPRIETGLDAFVFAGAKKLYVLTVTGASVFSNSL